MKIKILVFLSIICLFFTYCKKDNTLEVQESTVQKSTNQNSTIKIWPKGNITQADHDTLYNNLVKINDRGMMEPYTSKAIVILGKENNGKSFYSSTDWSLFFDEFYSLNNINYNYIYFFQHPMFYWLYMDAARNLVSKEVSQYLKV